MALIDQREAAKQIRGNKEYVADCEWLKGYNKACEDNAQIVEQMTGQEIINAADEYAEYAAKEKSGDTAFIEWLRERKRGSRMKKAIRIIISAVALYIVLVISALGWLYCDEEPWQ